MMFILLWAVLAIAMLLIFIMNYLRRYPRLSRKELIVFILSSILFAFIISTAIGTAFDRQDIK